MLSKYTPDLSRLQLQPTQAAILHVKATHIHI